jgi:hypothetical protein
MKKIRFVRDVFADGAKVHAVGDLADPAPAMAKHVRRGNAAEVDVEEARTEAKGSAKAKGKK